MEAFYVKKLFCTNKEVIIKKNNSLFSLKSHQEGKKHIGKKLSVCDEEKTVVFLAFWQKVVLIGFVEVVNRNYKIKLYYK